MIGVASDVINAVLSYDIGAINSEDNDIKFIIHRTDDYLPDVAFVNIYNLKQNIFSSILKNGVSNIFSVFVGISESYPLLLFKGALVPSSIKIDLKNIRTDLGYTSDTSYSFTLVEAFNFYSKFIEITYTDEVSAFAIIKDCAIETGLDEVIFSDTVSDVIYQSYKAVGKASVIVKQICNSLNTTFYIKNNNLYVGHLGKASLLMPVLNLSNSTLPVCIGANLYKLVTAYNPDIKPGNLLNVCFLGLLVGTFKVHQTFISGDTTKNLVEMTVIIGI